MSRRSHARSPFRWETAVVCSFLWVCSGCGRGTQQADPAGAESNASAPLSSAPESLAATDSSDTVNDGDYTNDPAYTPYVEHYSDGRVKLEGEFRHGKRHGVWTYYRSFNGSFLREERYRDGELLSMD